MALALEADKKELNLQSLVIKVVVGLLVFALCLLLKLGWKIQNAVFLATLAWAVFSFPRKLRRLLLTGSLILAIGLLSSPYIQSFIATNERASGLVKDATVQRLLSFVIGCIIGLVVVGLWLFIVLFISSEYVLALHEIAGVGRRDAIRMLWSLVMGIQLPWLIVENGNVTESRPRGVLPEVGGPGVVIIRPGNAVVFERHGEVTRIAGPGLVKTRLFERIKVVIDLRPQWTTLQAENVFTKDRVPLTIEYGVGYHIERKEETDERVGDMVESSREALTEEIGEVYRVYGSTIHRAAFNVIPAGWTRIVEATAERMLRDAVATLEFDQMFKTRMVSQAERGLVEDERMIQEIEQRVQNRLREAATAWGVGGITVNVMNIEMPAEVQQRVLDWWKARWRRKITLEEAESERLAALTKAEGQARALLMMERVKAAAHREMVEQSTTSPSSPPHQEVPSMSANTMPKSEKEKAELLELKRRRLHELKRKQALMGIGTPPEVLIEIEELEEDIRKLGG